MSTGLEDPIAVVLDLHRLLAEGSDDLAQVAVEHVGRLMQGTAALWLLLPDGEVEAVAFRHPDARLDAELQQVTGGGVRGTHRMVRMIMESDTQVRMDPVQVSAALQLMEPLYQSWFSSHPVCEMVLQPLRIGGRSTGLLGIARDAGQLRLDDGEQVLLTQIGQVMTAALQAQLVQSAQQQLLEQSRANAEKLHLLAHTDELTGLPNRRGFLAALHALEQPLTGSLAVALLDLDDFKDVNDGFGHAAGDELLTSFAAQCAQGVPAGSLLARMGGDEFAVLLRLDGDEPAEPRLLEVLDACPPTLPVLSVDVPVRVSAGLAVRHSGDTAVPGELLRESDVAMYRAKRERRRLTTFDAAADTAALSRLHDAARLRTAIERRELVLHYQRVVGLAADASQPERFEALVRWPTDDGVLLPDAFLPLATELGAMDAVTDLVVDLALAQLTAWQAAGRAARVAVNVPASSLSRTGFPHGVVGLLEAAGLPLDALSLEVTEGELVDDAARSAVASCRALGLSVAVDDFGMGYSALGYLLDVPAAEVKIDRSLVRDVQNEPGRRVLVEHCISLAHALGLGVVAEGIETAEQQALLVELGADWLQGFHLHRPCAPREL